MRLPSRVLYILFPPFDVGHLHSFSLFPSFQGAAGDPGTKGGPGHKGNQGQRVSFYQVNI